jgi:hypothetical protein
MDKPPTKTKPSAQAEETPDELRARGLQLAADYLSAFYRERTEENLDMWQLLSAIYSSPDRRRKLAQQEGQLAGQAARTNPPHPRKFWRKAWGRLVRPLVANCEGDSEEVARVLIATLPAELQAKCPDYPTNKTEFEAAVAVVVAEENFKPELTKCRNEGPWNPLLVARAVLRGLGMKPEDAKSLFRKSQWEAWISEHGTS